MLVATLAFFLLGAQGRQAQDFSPGQLTFHCPTGEVAMPLKHTGVEAQISGFGAEVTVDQTFTNPSQVPVEAVYTFPLPHDAAVNAMRIKIGSRIIEGTIKPRDEARAIYEEAKNAGQSAALLDQERPNIFTQSVANIMPGKQIDVEIHYVQVLKYEEGSFEFSFPMVVGPRYTNSTTTDTDKILPPYTQWGTHSGHTIDLNVDLNAGAPIREIHSILHKTDIQLVDQNHAKISLDDGDRVPNKDFILRYQLASGSVQSAVLSHYDPDKGGFFALLLMPPKAPKPEQIDSREFIFVMDESGSQSGWPIAKSKELTLKMIKTMRPGDTFNVLGFNTVVMPLWSHPRPYNDETLKEAEAFLAPMEGNGGTEIAAGVEAALDPPTDPERLRIVVFNTDGYVGEEKRILTTIRTHRRNARIFTFGIGNAVNHYLIDAMSEEGKGASDTLTLGEPSDEKVARFVRRTQTPVLTDVGVQFKGLEVSGIEPQQIPDVFDETPVVVYGRYSNPGTGHVVLQGNLGGHPWSQTIEMNLSDRAYAPAIESLWARKKVGRLERDDWAELVGEDRLSPSGMLMKVALEFGIMSSQTSFVAVEKRIVNVGGKQISVRVPVERIEGIGPKAYPNVPVIYNYATGNIQGVTQLSGGLYRGAAPGGSFGGRGAGPGGGGAGFGGTTGLSGGGGGFGGGGGGDFGGGAPTSQNSNTSASNSVNSGVRVIHIRHGDPGVGGYSGPIEELPGGTAVAGAQRMAQLRSSSQSGFRESKIEKSLLQAKGKVQIEILMNKLTDENLTKLKELGFKLDDEEKDLKVVFGTCDAAKLQDFADLVFVDKITKI